MPETVTYLTWLEEWFLVFEYFRGSTVRTIDSICSIYDIHYDGVLKIIRTKIQFFLNCRANWPTYLFMDEDRLLQDEKWDDKYDGKRVVFLDNTGISVKKPSDAYCQQ